MKPEICRIFCGKFSCKAVTRKVGTVVRGHCLTETQGSELWQLTVRSAGVWRRAPFISMCGAVRPARRRQSEHSWQNIKMCRHGTASTLRTVLLRGSYFRHRQSIWTHHDTPAVHLDTSRHTGSLSGHITTHRQSIWTHQDTPAVYLDTSRHTGSPSGHSRQHTSTFVLNTFVTKCRSWHSTTHHFCLVFLKTIKKTKNYCF